MKMYYLTRYRESTSMKTEYYIGGGQWDSNKYNRISLRLYESKRMAENARDFHGADIDVHEVEIVV